MRWTLKLLFAAVMLASLILACSASKEPKPDATRQDQGAEAVVADALPDTPAVDKALADSLPDGLGAADVGAGDVARGDASSLAPKVTMQKFGSPTWEVVDVQLFEGTGGSNPSTWLQAMMKVFTTITPAHEYFPYYAIGCSGDGTGTAHAPPYDDELGAGMKTAGYHSSGTFATSALTAPRALFLAMMMIPAAGAPTGSTFSYSSGPILDPNDFPIMASGQILRNGTQIDTLDGSICHPPPKGTNWSHSLWSWMENSFWITPLPGSYEIKVRFNDAANTHGWNISVLFTVTP